MGTQTLLVRGPGIIKVLSNVESRAQPPRTPEQTLRCFVLGIFLCMRRSRRHGIPESGSHNMFLPRVMLTHWRLLVFPLSCPLLSCSGVIVWIHKTRDGRTPRLQIAAFSEHLLVSPTHIPVRQEALWGGCGDIRPEWV